MQCKHHPHRRAEHFCFTCNSPICGECAEEVKPGVYTCFQCAMIHSVSEIGSTMAEKRERAAERSGKRKSWGPFQYFLVVSCVLIAVMWGVILFGGKSAPARSTEFAKEGRVLLFMVDGALKRYAQYEGNRYPERLSDLVPKYISLKESELSILDKLSYQLDPIAGYSLKLARPGPNDLNVVLSPKGVKYDVSGPGGR